MNIYEIVKNYGPIVAADEESGLLIVVNGSYVLLWAPRGPGEWDNVDCVSNSNWGTLCDRTAAEAIDRGEEKLKKWLKEQVEEEVS